MAQDIPRSTILYLDDENENLEGFKFLFRRSFNIILCQHSDAAFEALKNTEVKVVMSDQRMPDITGIAFLEKIRVLYPNPIRILITAYNDPDIILNAINRAGVYHFFMKPWNKDEVGVVLANAIEAYDLKKNNELLINGLKSANEELMRAKERAEESDRLKTSFLANMSHEIRTPLNAIIGFTNLIIGGGIDEDAKTLFARIIQTSSSELIHIVEDILDTSRIEAGAVAIRESEIDLPDFLSELLHLFRHNEQAIEKHLFLELVVPEFPLNSLYADPIRLKQILTNLLSNAVKFTHEGGIRFGYQVLDVGQKSQLRFFVTDTGIGILPEYHEIVFERFKKLESDKTNLYRGNGLGLFIARKLALLMGGTITLESEPGHGSTFYVTLPCTTSGRPSVSPPVFSSVKGEWNGKRILVVEDEESNYRYIEALLRNRAGVVWARDGIEALEWCEKARFNLVLMDIKLPRLDGLAATREIKKRWNALPVIALTAYASPLDRQACFEAGCDNFLSKPFIKEEIYLLIDTHIA